MKKEQGYAGLAEFYPANHDPRYFWLMYMCYCGISFLAEFVLADNVFICSCSFFCNGHSDILVCKLCVLSIISYIDYVKYPVK